MPMRCWRRRGRCGGGRLKRPTKKTPPGRAGRVTFKLHSKQAALEQIGTELGMFVRRTDNQHRVEKRFSELSEDEQEAVAAELLSRARAVIAEQKIIESEAQEVA